MFQIALSLAGVSIAFLLQRKSAPLVRTAILMLIFGAALVVSVSYLLPWLFTPVVAGWFLLSLVFLVLVLRDRPRRNLLLSTSMVVLPAAGLFSVFMNPAFMFEFIFKLLEPRDCATALAPVRISIPLPNETPELYESIVALDDGSFLVTAATRGEVIQVSESGDARILSQLPTGTFNLTTFSGMLSGMTRGRDGATYTMVLASDPANKGIWRIDDNGSAELWSPFPAASGGNGLTTDSSGNIYVADAILGLIWKVAPAGGSPEVWIEHEMLGAGANFPMPTANGIKISDDTVFVSNTLHQQVVRIEIEDDGSAGDISI